jgi:diguanylate cyclase
MLNGQWECGSVEKTTGLPGRQEFIDYLRSRPASGVYICLLDIDKFRFLNSAVGIVAADLALQQISEVLRQHIAPGDHLGRTGDDEFAVSFVRDSLQEARQKATELMAALASYQLDWNGQIFNFTACAGLAAVSSPDTAEHSLHLAMAACSAAKDAGRGSLIVAGEASVHSTNYHRDARILTGLLSAIAEDRLRLYAQEIFSLTQTEGDTLEFELLVHMVDTDGTSYPPSAIIPAAERHGFIRELDRWVMKAVLIDNAELLRSNPNVMLSLNLSGDSLSDPTLWEYIAGLFAKSSVAKSRIQFEITETSPISDMPVALAFVKAVRAHGCKVALDDFGSGLSSFVYLRTFPVDCIKIDGAFVGNVMHSASADRAIIKSIVGVARDLGVTVVAEHVDSHGVLGTLRELGINKIQGYLISQPKPFSEMFKI